MIQSLINAINNGKISNEVQSIEIFYSTPELSGVLIDHPRIEGLKVIPGTVLSASEFDTEISNAFFQWSLLFNNLYGSFATVNFVRVKQDSDADLHIIFNTTTVKFVEKISANTLQLNLGINWTNQSSAHGLLLLNYLVRGVGLLIGISDTVVVSPMNPSNLGINYLSLYNISRGEFGSISAGYLTNYSSVTNNVISTYGTSVTNTPLILGCTDPNATNYNPDATINAGVCQYLESPFSTIDRNTNYSYLRNNYSEYFLANNSNVYEYSVGTFENPASIIDQNDSIISALPVNLNDNGYPLTSLVITDKYEGDYSSSVGEIRYYCLINVDGNLNIFNSDGQLVSNLNKYNDIEYTMSSFTHSTRQDIFLSNFKFYYSQNGANDHYLYWTNKSGISYNLKLNDALPQTNSSGEIVSACNLDTYTYGNIDSVSAVNIGGEITNVSVRNGKIYGVNQEGSPSYVGKMFNTASRTEYGSSGATGILGINNLNHTEMSLETYPIDNGIFENIKHCILPTIAGIKTLKFHSSENFLEITTLNLASSEQSNTTEDSRNVFTWVGDQEMYYEGSYTEQEIGSEPSLILNDPDANMGDPIDVRNTKMDVTPFYNSQHLNSTLLRPFSLGFSFDDKGLVSLSNKKWEDGEFKLGTENEEEETSIFTGLPLSIGNKLFRNSFFCNKNNIAFQAWAVPSPILSDLHPLYINTSFTNASHEATSGEAGAYNSFRHVGDFHLAIGMKHGFVLAKVNNTNFSLVSPTTENGVELHIAGGSPLMNTFNGGWTPISMEFSPDDNFLYTIIENPEDSNSRRIAIYNIHSGTGEGESYGCTHGQLSEELNNSVRVIDVDEMDLQKVTLQDDGCIYFWGSDNKYMKITDPDLEVSVNIFASNPNVYSLSEATHVPSKSYLRNSLLHNLSLIEQASHMKYEDNDNRIKYAQIFNSKEPATDITSGIFPINSFEFNSKIVAPGFTFDVTTNTIQENVLNSSTIIDSLAVQTSNELDLNIVAFIESSLGMYALRGFDGTLLDQVGFGPSAAAMLNFDSQNSVFMFPDPNVSNRIIYGFITSHHSINLESFTAEDNSVLKDGTSYSYSNIQDNDRYLTSINIPTGTNANANIRGHEIVKTNDNQYKFIRTHTDNEIKENKRNIYLCFATPQIGVLGASGIEYSSASVFVHHLLEDKLVANGDSYTAEGSELYTRIKVSSNKQYIVIGTMSKSASLDYTECVISAFNLNINDRDNILGTQIGESVRMSASNFLVDKDLVPMTNTVIRDLEFSVSCNKVYVLLGKHDNGLNSHSISTLSKSNRILRLKLDKTNNTFGFDGILVEPGVFDAPAANRTSPFITYNSEGKSNQGSGYYKANTAPVGFYTNPVGEIFISNRIEAGLASEEDSTRTVIAVNGIITNSDSSDSRLLSNAAVRFADEVNSDLVSVGLPNNVSKIAGVAGNLSEEELENLDKYNLDINPEIQAMVVGPQGCTDITALNYDPNATGDDGSCIYTNNVTCNGLGSHGVMYGSNLAQWPLVINNLTEKINLQIQVCAEGDDTIGIIGRNINAEFNEIASVLAVNEICNDQCYYIMTVSMTVNTTDGNAESNPWFGNYDDCEIITVQENFVYIPAIVFQNGENWNDGYMLDTAYPGNIFNFVGDYVSGGEPGTPTMSFDTVQGPAWDAMSLMEQANYLLGQPVNWISSGIGGPANLFLEADFNTSYCLTCTDPNTPNFVADGSILSAECSQHDPWCVSNNSISNCGKYGCMNSNACNYDPTATHNQGCITPSDYVNPHGVDIGEVCGCTGFIVGGGSSLEYCGTCSDPDNIFPKSEFCDCDGNPKHFYECDTGTSVCVEYGYYGNCSGLEPTPTEIANSCYYDINGVLQEPAGGVTNFNGNCDCQGTTGFGAGCGCTGVDTLNNTEIVAEGHWCDCTTVATKYYPEGEVVNGMAQCDAQPVWLCEKTSNSAFENSIPTHNHFYSGMHLNEIPIGDFYDIVNEVSYTAAEVANNFVQGSQPSNVQCEPCALAGPNGELQLENPCIPNNRKCKYIVNNTSGAVSTNPDFTNYFYNAECAQCQQVGAEECCQVWPEGHAEAGQPILDYCGACVNLTQSNGGVIVVPNSTGFDLTLYNTSGEETVTSGSALITCDPCSVVNNISNYNMSATAFGEILNAVTADYCGECGSGQNLITYFNRLRGFIVGEFPSGGQFVKCSCESNPVNITAYPNHPILRECCPGYYYDSCAYGGSGGCVPNGTLAIPKDCAGECGIVAEQSQNAEDIVYVFNNGTNSCGECMPMVNDDPDPDQSIVETLLSSTPLETYNAVGCCGNDIIDCTGECVRPSSALVEDFCGECGGDGSTCSGCTDATAFNYDASATQDDGSCSYQTLYTVLDQASSGNIDLSSATPALTEELFWDASTIDVRTYSAIIANKEYVLEDSSELHGFDIFTDQYNYTTKCQVISNTNTVLYISNPLRNAEISYINANPYGTIIQEEIVQHESYQGVGYDAAGNVKHIAKYYFAIDKNVILTEQNLEILFGEHLDKISVITNVNHNQYFPEAFDNVSPIRVGDFNTEITNETEGPLPASGMSSLLGDILKTKYIYQVIPKINKNTGIPEHFTVDFSSFIFEEIPGCMDFAASNFNFHANVHVDTECEYAPVVSGPILNLSAMLPGLPTRTTDLKWVLYDSNNNVIKYNFGVYPPFSIEANGYPYNVNLGSINACAYFLPIGFKYNDSWKEVSLRILENNYTYLSLIEGSNVRHILQDPENKGSIILDKRLAKLDDTQSCNHGCGESNLRNILQTDYCKASIKKDIKEFTDIHLKWEIASPIILENENTNVRIKVFDLDTGHTLIDVDMIEELQSGDFSNQAFMINTEYVKSFAIDKQTRIGVSIDSYSDLKLKYELVSEYGDIIKKKIFK